MIWREVLSFSWAFYWFAFVGNSMVKSLFLLNFLFFIYFGLGFLEWVGFCFDFNHLTICYEVIDLECPDVRFWLCRDWLLRKENMQYGTKFLWKVWMIILAIKMLILVATYAFGCLKKKKQALHLDACLSSVNWNTLKVAFRDWNFQGPDI